MPIPILYSFRRCPYAIRARMALAYAGVIYELREVSLKNKPKEMLDISPKGTTPVLQIFKQIFKDSPYAKRSSALIPQPLLPEREKGSKIKSFLFPSPPLGEGLGVRVLETSAQDFAQDFPQNFIVLEESLDIMNWAIAQNDPQNWQDLSKSSLAIATQLIITNDREFKQALDRYKYANRFPERSPEFYRQQAEEFLQVLELQLHQNAGFLVGDRQTLADVAIFPFVRQMAYVDIDWFRSSDYKHLQAWLTWHETSSLFERVMQKFPVFDSAVRSN